MEKINIITDTTDFEYWFEDTNGRKLNIKRYYLNRIDLDNLVQYQNEETKKFPTLQRLVEEKKLFYKTAYKEAEVRYKRFMSKISVDTVIKKFKKQGFNVTKEAIEHNFNAYLLGGKSGYRDEKNGYHLFTPCFLNPLSFRLSTLNKNCDWQTTYIC